MVSLGGSHLPFLGDTVHRSFRLETAHEEDDYCPIAQANIIEAKFEADEPQTKCKTNCKAEQDADFKEAEQSEADVMGTIETSTTSSICVEYIYDIQYVCNAANYGIIAKKSSSNRCK